MNEKEKQNKITDTTTKESHQDQLVGSQTITSGIIGKCILYRPTLVPSGTDPASQVQELAPLPDFGVEIFTNCSFSDGVAALSPITKRAGGLKIDMITQIAPPTAQDPKHLVMTVGTATVPDTIGQSFVIKQISRQQVLTLP